MSHLISEPECRSKRGGGGGGGGGRAFGLARAPASVSFTLINTGKSASLALFSLYLSIIIDYRESLDVRGTRGSVIKLCGGSRPFPVLGDRSGLRAGDV